MHSGEGTCCGGMLRGLVRAAFCEALTAFQAPPLSPDLSSIYVLTRDCDKALR